MNFSLIGLAAAATLGLVSFAHTAVAGAPQVKTQAPGFYRMTLGDFEVTTVLDGVLFLDPNKLLTNTKPGQVDALLAKQHQKSPVETSVNTFLINTGSKLVLIDTGAGALFGPTLGAFLANLKAAGYSPEQIDDICITHMHGDHLGGLVSNGKRTFPNAVVHVDKAEADHWLSQANLDKAPAPAKGGFQTAMSVLKPYQDAGKLQAAEGGAQIVPGIRSVAAHGHTPGHSLYSVESKGEKLVLWGDLLHVAAVQFPEPSVTIAFDTDSPTARTQREKALAEAAAQGYWVGIAHASFPGIGHVSADGTNKSYTWVPLQYSANRPMQGKPLGQ
jgi:glyoxylase-like metal-dependent hydrolase (beta-lactamase superfamily II)